MTDRSLTYDYDAAVVAPLRAHGLAQRVTASLLGALLEAEMTVVVIDSTDTTLRAAFTKTANAEIIELLRHPLAELARPGHLGRVQTAVVVSVEAARPLTALRSGVHADSAVVVAGDLVRTDREALLDLGEAEEPPTTILELRALADEVKVATQAQTLRWGAVSPEALRLMAEQLPAEEPLTVWPSGVRSVEGSSGPRTLGADAVPRLGRHIVAAEPAWPKDPRIILRHLPRHERADVRIFGPHARLVRQVGAAPQSWTLHSVAGPRDLAELDVWIALTADTQQILGDRAIHEALAAGLIVVLPAKDELRAAFGDAAVYADAVGVRGQISHLQQHPELFAAQSARAQRFAQDHSAQQILARLDDSGLSEPLAPRPAPCPLPVPRSGRRRFRLALVTSNGAGMGHLTRLLAIARRLPEHIEPVFISLSQAVDVVGGFGYPYAYIASKSETGLSASVWNTYGEARFTEELTRLTPDALVFDGTWPYRGLTAAARATGTPMIWSRRGMWREEAGDRSLAHSSLFDLLIEPGEFAAEADRGATTRVDDAHRVGPVTVLSREELLPRAEARERLQLGAEDQAVLVTLGAGNLNDIDTTTTDVIHALKEHLPQWRIFLTSNPLSMADSSYSGVESVQIYPIAEYANAFDLTVSAAGYNSFHEWISACVPTLWMPNTSTQTDDQVARGRYAEQAGVGLSLEDPDREQIFAAVQSLAAPGVIDRMRQELESRNQDNGAPAAAELITRHIVEGRVTVD